MAIDLTSCIGCHVLHDRLHGGEQRPGYRQKQKLLVAGKCTGSGLIATPKEIRRFQRG